jgi:hypothetical protein
VERVGPDCFAHTKPSESKRRLPEVAADLQALLGQFRGTAAAQLDSLALLGRIFQEQCALVDGSETAPALQIKDPQEIPCDNVLNPADPDASDNAHRGTGYLVQVMETYAPEAEGEMPEHGSDKPDLITYVAVGPMNTHDSAALQPALAEATQRGIAPQRLLADSHYGSDDNLHNAEAQQVELVSPAMPPKGSKQEKLTLERFELDEQGLIVRCSEGQMPVSRSAGADKLQVLFAEATCRACPWQQGCCASAVSRKEPRYQYTHDRVRQRARRLRDRTPEFRERYRWRAGIEGTMSRYQHQLGMGQLRVRGLKAARYTAFLRALGLNIHRVAAYRMAG